MTGAPHIPPRVRRSGPAPTPDARPGPARPGAGGVKRGAGRRPWAAGALAWLLLTGAAVAEDRPAEASWTGSWASAQEAPDAQNALSDADLTDVTLREIVHLSVGGRRLRVRLSNAFGRTPLRIGRVRVALATAAGAATVGPGGGRELSFDGRPDVLIPAGADWWSDPLPLPVGPGVDLALSLYLPAPPQPATSHPGAHATSFLVQGDHTADADFTAARRIEHWFFVSGVDVEGPARAVLVTLGDSITDGHGSTSDGNDRWPDDLARRLHASGRDIGVLNVGIGGNHLLTDGLGPNAVARFDRDVLAQSGARVLLLLEGVNDIGLLSRDAPTAPPQAHADLLRQLFAADAQLIVRAHAHGLRVIGATLTPFAGSDYYHPAAANEADRQALNAWIRTPGRFDAVADFDRALRDPAHPDRLQPAFDSGDHLHPSPAGYLAMANAVPVGTLEISSPATPARRERARPARASGRAFPPR